MGVAKPTVVLFDVDGTLIRTEGRSRHSRAFKGAFRQVYGCECTFATGMHGMTDLQIFGQLARDMDLANGNAAETAALACRTMVDIYAAADEADGTYVELPGVRPLLETLRDRGVLLGLITGNVPEIARDKLETTALQEFFTFGAFGSEGDSRRVLPPLAVRRAEQILGVRVNPARVFVIGDTPRDVDAALSNGYRAVAVATGHLPMEELSKTGADLVVADLSDPLPVLQLLDLRVASAEEEAASR